MFLSSYCISFDQLLLLLLLLLLLSSCHSSIYISIDHSLCMLTIVKCIAINDDDCLDIDDDDDDRLDIDDDD